MIIMVMTASHQLEFNSLLADDGETLAGLQSHFNYYLCSIERTIFFVVLLVFVLVFVFVDIIQLLSLSLRCRYLNQKQSSKVSPEKNEHEMGLFAILQSAHLAVVTSCTGVPVEQRNFSNR